MKEVNQQPERPRSWWGGVNHFIDQCVYAFSPRAGAARMAFRHQVEPLLHAFEGAGADDTRGGSWLGSKLSADSIAEMDLGDLRTRSRELTRNDWVGGVIDDKVNHVVGTGFTPQSKIDPRLVGTEAAAVFNAENESMFERWSQQVDISGRLSLWLQTRLAERHLEMDGEALVVMSDDATPGRPIPLVVEVIDPERLETPPKSLAGDRSIRLGIERDKDQKIVAYWIRKSHPHDTVEISMKFDRVEAWRVCHVFERWFAGQSRGLPWLCRTLNKLKDCKDLDEAIIIAQQVQACFAVFVETTDDPVELARQAASGVSASTGKPIQEVRPGGVHYLKRGQKPTFTSPTSPSGSYTQVQEMNYRRIASAMNWPYEMAMKNWAGLSFAAGRLVLTGLRMTIATRQRLIDELMLRPIWNRMVEETVILGRSSIEPRFYFLRPWVYLRHIWTPPAWRYAITPGEEVQANIDAVNNNFKTLAEVIIEGGGDPEQVLAQRKIEVDRQKNDGTTPVDSQVKAQASGPSLQQQELLNAA